MKCYYELKTFDISCFKRNSGAPLKDMLESGNGEQRDTIRKKGPEIFQDKEKQEIEKHKTGHAKALVETWEISKKAKQKL